MTHSAHGTVPALGLDQVGLRDSVLIGLVPVALAALVVLVTWWRSRDELFTAVTPGLLPGPRDPDARERIRGGEWAGTVAPQFDPPAGVSPGVAGTVIDGVAHTHDVSAVIIDLAVRGWFRISEAPRAEGAPRDWVLHRNTPDPSDPLTAFEGKLLVALFTSGPDVRLSTLKGTFGVTMREAQIGLYREVVDRGWYRRHPRARNARLRFWALLVLLPITLLGLGLVAWEAASSGRWAHVPLVVGGVLAIAVLTQWGGSRTPRTAEGTAARIQAMGFREYLATAEAEQLRFEELRTIVARYLPYAVAFGLTAHWAQLFAALAQEAHTWEGPDWDVDLDWYESSDGTTLGDAFTEGLGSGISDLGDAAGDLADFGDLGDAGDVGDLADLTDGIDSFAEATEGLFAIDGLPGCGDGCDLPGCDF